MLGVVVQIDGFDPAIGEAVTLRAASHDHPAVCHAGGGAPWWPAIIKLPTLRYDLFDGAFGGEITAPSSSLSIAAEPWPDFARYALADARLRLWTGDVGAPWSSWTLRFDGRVTEQPELADGSASISFAVDDRWLDAALLTTYAGTSGAEGTEALKGQPKPLALGAPRYVSGTLIDTINSVFQLSAYGPLRNFEAALERLARYGDRMTRIRIIIAVGALLAIVAVVAMIRRGGETAGAAKVTTKVEKAHTAQIVEARADERAAATVTQSIAARTVRIDAQTDAYVQATIKDLRNALADVPPAAADAALPTAPVDSLRDSLNAGIARANRAGDDADAAGGAGQD